MDPQRPNVCYTNNNQFPLQTTKTFYQPINNSKIYKHEAQYFNPNNRQATFQPHPRDARNVATVIPIGSKSNHCEPLSDRPQDIFARNQIHLQKYNIPDDTLSMQHFPRIHDNQQNMLAYKSNTNLIGGIRGSMQQPFSQMPIEMISSYPQRFPSEQNLPIINHQQYIQAQYPTDIMPQMLTDPLASEPRDRRSSGVNNANLMSSLDPNVTGNLPINSMTYDNYATGSKQNLSAPLSTGQKNDPEIIATAPPPTIQSQMMPLTNQNMMMMMMEGCVRPNMDVPGCQPPISPNPIVSRINNPSNQSFRNTPSCGKQIINTTRENPLHQSQTTISLPPQSIPVPLPGTTCSNCLKNISTSPDKFQGTSKSSEMKSVSTRNQSLPPIQCEAGCMKWFHLGCSGLTLDAFLLLKGEPLAEWLCNPCATRAYPNIPYIKMRH